MVLYFLYFFSEKYNDSEKRHNFQKKKIQKNCAAMAPPTISLFKMAQEGAIGVIIKYFVSIITKTVFTFWKNIYSSRQVSERKLENSVSGFCCESPENTNVNHLDLLFSFLNQFISHRKKSTTA